MYLISYEGKRTGKDSPSKILTMLSISNQTISVIGPTIGGLLIHSGGWQAIFLVNIPLSILSFVFGFLYYPKVESPKKLNALKEQIDFIGITLFTITLTTWMIFFMEPDQSIFYLFIIGLFSLIAFIIMELKSKKPFIDLRVLAHNGALNNTYIRSLLTAVISYSVLYGYVQWLEEGRGLTAAHAGLMMLPQFLVGIFMAQLTGTRLSIKFKLYLGTICALITMIELPIYSCRYTIMDINIISCNFWCATRIIKFSKSKCTLSSSTKINDRHVSRIIKNCDVYRCNRIIHAH
ncbi:MFS transporter [Mammaliicoccus sciuri]|nr:MFS transporter [Mammaliicoccus sciuri]